MQVAGTTAAGAHRKATGQMSLRSGRESPGLFVPHVDPVDCFSAPHRVGKSIEGIADDAINAFDSRFFESLDKIFCCGFAHDLSPFAFSSSFLRRELRGK
jgi:hypothetical protein